MDSFYGEAFQGIDIFFSIRRIYFLFDEFWSCNSILYVPKEINEVIILFRRFQVEYLIGKRKVPFAIRFQRWLLPPLIFCRSSTLILDMKYFSKYS